MNYHKILGVTKNACKKTIREAYLKKVKLYHPDINKSSDATSKFKQIQEAYQALHNDDYSQKSYHSENPYSKSNKPEETKNKQNYNYSDDFSDFQRSFYEDVRVTKNACKKTIREAYLKKVKLYHPDINKSSDATSKFKQIQEAYQALHNDDYSQKSYHSENPYSKSNKPEETKNKQNYNYSDDFSDFQRSFYEDVRKMRENERKEYHRVIK
ncbi:DnaJ domain containing protein [Plasmodium malariae]|uniref:DnaJ domain containing protein n=1 Tax=Plasmodium malariae TaxID=5858 RepID=A0A1A8W4I5_PLAMA|nr:DnaJ domain containing protein [Plasmodium malariae]